MYLLSISYVTFTRIYYNKSMFPLSDSAKATRFPILTIALIAVNIFIFFKQITAPDVDAFVMQYALIPANIDFGNYQTLIPFVTAIFLHGSILHILSNMWFLWIFGDNVEGALSHIGYLFFFIIAGVLGNLAQYLLMPDSTIPVVGASGAIAGVLGYYAVAFPHSQVRTLIFLFFFVTIVNVSAFLILGYWFVLQLVSGFDSIGLVSDQGGIAFFAHIGGFIVGLITGMFMKPKSMDYNPDRYF